MARPSTIPFGMISIVASTTMGKVMRFYKLLLIVTLILPTILLSEPRPLEGISYQDGILSLSDRRFVVSDLSQNVEKYDGTFSLRQSAWLAPILNEDLVVKSWKVEFIWAGVHGNTHVDTEADVLQKPNVAHITEPSVSLQGYDAYTQGPGHLYFLPNSSSLDYSAFCGREPGSTDLNICFINVIYPYDPYVVLEATKFFPGTLNEVPREFESVATRMVEIAVCLDVTNQSDAERESAGQQPFESPADLSECELQISS